MKGKKTAEKIKEKCSNEMSLKCDKNFCFRRTSNSEKAITLVALVVTIIILLILTGVTISSIAGNTGLLKRAGDASNSYEKAGVNELEGMNTMLGEIDQAISGSNGGTIVSDGSWSDTKGINTPKLVDGMTPVTWDGTTEKRATDVDKWYNYVAQTGTTDQTSYWANAKTNDGSYWVWVPRYEYKITHTADTTPSDTNAGKIEVKFISIEKVDADTGYTIHPAFTNDKSNGGWKSQLAGIWVAKYETSMETNKVATTTSDTTIGNVSITSTITAVSKPNVSSWRNITIANCYTNGYNYDRTKESHLMKNSEWGAVAYLTHSQYGRNGNQIYINNSSSFITGNSGGSINATGAANTTNSYNTPNGVKASSTGNITGIYDLSGGANEYIAAFNSSDSDRNEPYYGSSFAGTSKSSSEYATKYENNSTAYAPTSSIYKKGDATYEVFVSSGRNWFNDNSYFINSSMTFFKRGGTFSSESYAGIFYSSGENGDANANDSFRIVLSV